MKKNNIIQLSIIIVIFPLISIVVGMLTSKVFNFDNIFVKLISNVPVFNDWYSILYYYDNDFLSVNNVNMKFSPVSTFFEIIFLAFIIKAGNAIHYESRNSGLPIISTFVSCFAGLILISVISKFTNGGAQIFAYIILIGMILIGIRFLFSSLFTAMNRNLRIRIIELIISGVCGFIISGYICVLFFAFFGCFNKFDKELFIMFIFIVLSLIFILISYLYSCYVRNVKVFSETYRTS